MNPLSRRIERKIAAYQNELIATHFAEVENMYAQVRGWAHDYRNHMQVLSATPKRATSPPSVSTCRVGRRPRRAHRPIKTGNRMADAILGSKISLARAKRIPVTIDAHVPFALSVSQVDLCAILGNLFDNAIEATLPLPEEERA